MARGNDLVIAVTADASSVASGLKPATAALGSMEKEAAEAGKALSNLDKMKVDPEVTLTLNQQAIAKTRADLNRLRDQVAQDVIVGADTTAAQKEIAKLEKQLRQLRRAEVQVDVKTTGAEKLETLHGSLTSLKGVGALAATGLGALAVSFVKMAADAETASLQMKAVVRDGGDVAKILADLRKFGEESPFEFKDLQDAARKLISFGVASKDVVQLVKDLGEAAAATSVPIGDMATIYGQMVAKGKLQSEELLQMAERGVDVYGALSSALGITREQARALAEEGKLGREEIQKLGRELGKIYAGSVAAQAKTLNGQMSTMNDNLATMGRIIGEKALPRINDLLKGFNQLTGATAEAAGEQKNWFEQFGHDIVFGPESPTDRFEREKRESEERQEQLEKEALARKQAVEAAHLHAAELERVADATSKTTRTSELWRESFDSWAGAADELEDELSKIVESLDIMNGRFLDTREATVDYQRALDDMNESIAKHGKTLDLDTEAGRENDDAVRAQAKSLVELTEARLRDAKASGGSTDEILADYAAQRAELQKVLVTLGLSEDQAKAYVDQLLRAPEDIATDVKLTGVETARSTLDKLTEGRNMLVNVELQLSDYQKRKLAQDVRDSLQQNEVTRSGVQSVTPNVSVAPRIYLDGEPIRAMASRSGARAGAQAARAARSGGRL